MIKDGEILICDNCGKEVTNHLDIQIRRDNEDLVIYLCEACCKIHHRYEKRVRNELKNMKRRIFNQDFPDMKRRSRL